MRTSILIFAFACCFLLLVSLVPETDAQEQLLQMMKSKSLKKKVMKKIVYLSLLQGNRKIYAIPFPLPLPVPILKKLQPIIYKETQTVHVPAPYPVPVYQHYDNNYGGGYDQSAGGYGNEMPTGY